MGLGRGCGIAVGHTGWEAGMVAHSGDPPQFPAQPGIPGNTHGVLTHVPPRPTMLHPRGMTPSMAAALKPHTASSLMQGGCLHIPPPHPSKCHPQVHPRALPHCQCPFSWLLPSPSPCSTFPGQSQRLRPTLGPPSPPLSSSPQHTGLQSIGLLRSCAPHTHLSHLSLTHSGDRTPGAGLCPSLDVAARGLASQTQSGKAGTAHTAPGAKRWRGRRQLPLK